MIISIKLFILIHLNFMINIIFLNLILNLNILNFLIINVIKLTILIYLNFLINIIFLNLIIYYWIYNYNHNYNLVKLINLSKLFTNVYKSLLSFILLNTIVNQYLYVKYYFLYLNLIQLLIHYSFCYFNLY